MADFLLSYMLAKGRTFKIQNVVRVTSCSFIRYCFSVLVLDLHGRTGVVWLTSRLKFPHTELRSPCSVQCQRRRALLLLVQLKSLQKTQDTLNYALLYSFVLWTAACSYILYVFLKAKVPQECKSLIFCVTKGGSANRAIVQYWAKVVCDKRPRKPANVGKPCTPS